MILNDDKIVTDYRGNEFHANGEFYTMKGLALEALEFSKIEDPNQKEIAGRAMMKIYKGEALNQHEKTITKIVMMAVYDIKYLDYISKQFEDAD